MADRNILRQAHAGQVVGPATPEEQAITGSPFMTGLSLETLQGIAANTSGLTSADELDALLAQLLGDQGDGSQPLPFSSSREALVMQLAFERERLAQTGQLEGRQLDLFEQQIEQEFGIRREELDLARDQLSLDTELGRGQLQLGQGQLKLDRRRVAEEEQRGFAERASNPRRILEAIFLQGGRQPSTTAKSLQSLADFNKGGQVEGGLADALDRRINGKPTKAAGGKTVQGPALIVVGEGKNDEGIKAGTAEVVAAPPGTVVAPLPKGQEPTVANAQRAIGKQMESANGGASVSPTKARTMLRHGEVRGRPLSTKQRGFFGVLAGGDEPTRAQGGIFTTGSETTTTAGSFTPQEQQWLDLYEQAIRGDITIGAEGMAKLTEAVGPLQERLFEDLRKRFVGEVLEATKPSGTTLFDPLGGSTLGKTQRGQLAGTNLRDLMSLSDTQRGAFDAALSASQADPADFETSRRRQFRGFNPVGAGATSRFGGIFG